ncbi:MAG: undecaprenyl/decaprenyl-phosphate alpha-N-acetylglucosaminyl 1-phosphate transferase [Thermoguttaceae bacterium]|nr:undecaprenyl/decaprenyl-phosphate alpha-N-acetylglucosaminyl 1-phosphate transferase [Thermoguttaceae bacterium]
MLTSVCAVLFLLSLGACFFYANVARRRGWLDRPVGPRKNQKKEVPVGGGVAVMSVALAGFYVRAPSFFLDPAEFQLATSAAFVACWCAWLGFLDDRRELSAPTKLVLQLIPALLFCLPFWASAERTTFLYAAPDADFLMWRVGKLGFLALAAWVVLSVNAFNLLDGADGFATVFAITVLATLAIVVSFWTEPSEGITFACWGLCAILAGFLVLNFPPARLYLGDSGSLSIGFLVSFLALAVFYSQSIARPAPFLALFALPTIDVLFAILRRKLLGAGIFFPDLEHIHHRLARRFGPGVKSLLVFLALQLPVCAAVVVAYRTDRDAILLIVGALYLVGLPLSGLFGREEIVALAQRWTRFYVRDRFERDGAFFAMRRSTFDRESDKIWRDVLKDFRDAGCVSLSMRAKDPDRGFACKGIWSASRDERRGATHRAFKLIGRWAFDADFLQIRDPDETTKLFLKLANKSLTALKIDREEASEQALGVEE